MRKNKIRRVERAKRYLILVALLGMFILTPIGSTAASTSVNNQQTPQIADISNQFSQSSIVASRLEGKPIIKDLSLEIPLIGYRITPRAVNHLDWDESGLLTLRGASPNSVSVYLNLKYGIYEYYDLSVTGRAYADSVGNIAYELQTQDILKGFFMELSALPKMTFVDLAFDAGNSQLSYRGLTCYGTSLANIPISRTSQDMESSEFSFVVPEYASRYMSLTFEQLDQNLRTDYQKSIQISVNPSFQQQLETSPSLTVETSTSLAMVTPAIVIPEIMTCGVANYWSSPYGSLKLPAKLPTEYWTLANGIDFAICQNASTKAQVKSDLQYYNKMQIGRYIGYENELLVYEVMCHSGAAVNTEWHQLKSGGDIITPTEIAGLWYHTVNGQWTIDVHPRQTVIHASVCYGYSSDDSTPHMAQAFVDYGAAAFVGATVEIAWDGGQFDDFTGAFWTSLSKNHQTVYTATISYINRHNQLRSDTWNYGVEIKIYGNINKIV